MATVCKLGGGSSKKKINAAKRLEGVTSWSEGPAWSDNGDGGNTWTKKVTCPANSETAWIVVFMGYACSNTAANAYFTTNGTYIQTNRAGSMEYSVKISSGQGSKGNLCVCRLEPGQYIECIMETWSAYYHRAGCGFMVFDVPKADD